jgi:hypothetical protein
VLRLEVQRLWNGFVGRGERERKREREKSEK